jgi:K+/H+ antiporter YhaU regulatory subunit KhtT
LAKGEIDVYRVPVGKGSSTVGRAIADIGRSSNWIIAVIRRGDEAVVPTAQHHIAVGDTLVIVGTKGLERTFSRLFDATRE